MQEEESFIICMINNYPFTKPVSVPTATTMSLFPEFLSVFTQIKQLTVLLANLMHQIIVYLCFIISCPIGTAFSLLANYNFRSVIQFFFLVIHYFHQKTISFKHPKISPPTKILFLEIINFMHDIHI